MLWVLIRITITLTFKVVQPVYCLFKGHGFTSCFIACDKDVRRSSLRSAMRAASQLPGEELTDVDDAPAPAC